jgi:hypothetical protein
MSRFFAGASDSESDSSSEDEQIIKAPQSTVQQTIIVSKTKFNSNEF